MIHSFASSRKARSVARTGVILIVGLFSWSAAQAEQSSTQDCVSIKDALARLACFDARYGQAETETPDSPPTPSLPPNPNQGSQPQADTTVAPSAATVPAIVEEPVAPVAPVTADEPATPAARQAPADDPGTFSRGSMFSKKERVEFASKIAAVRKGDKQRMVYRLDNDEIWMQITPRDFPIKEGDAVRIKSGLLGGFSLHTESGTTTRVRRIK